MTKLGFFRQNLFYRIASWSNVGGANLQQEFEKDYQKSFLLHLYHQSKSTKTKQS